MTARAAPTTLAAIMMMLFRPIERFASRTQAMADANIRTAAEIRFTNTMNPAAKLIAIRPTSVGVNGMCVP